MAKSLKVVVLMLAVIILAAGCIYFGVEEWWQTIYFRSRGMRTVEDVIQKFGPAADAEWQRKFAAAGIAYPPAELTLIALKQEKILEVWATAGSARHCVASWPILAASGKAGPKLRQGDLQVPEGFYRLAGLNPNSSFHLSMKINYPNEFDLQKATAEGRLEPGGDIFIHGRAVSIGCLAMGDPVIEQLFVLVQRVGYKNVEVLMLPWDLRRQTPPDNPQPDWMQDIYTKLQARLREFSAG